MDRNVLAAIMNRHRARPDADPLAPGRQSVNVEYPPPNLTPSRDDLLGAVEGSLSNWDFLHRKHLTDPAPVERQVMDFPVVDASRLSQVLVPNDPEAQRMSAEVGGGIANPGTLLRAQSLNRTLQDTANPALLPETPFEGSWFNPDVSLGEWGSDYETAEPGPRGDYRSDRFRPGLRHAPWNQRK